jgi:hypothetical protein
MKKILFVHHAAGWGGAPLNMINIIKSFKKTKFHVHVLLLKDSIVAEKLLENNIPYTVANTLFYRKYYQYFAHSVANYVKWYQLYKFIKLTLFWFLSNKYFAKEELKKHDFDIIHLNSSVLSDWLKPGSKKGKVVYHIQEPLTKGIFGFRYSFFRKQAKKYADKIIAISNDNAKRIDLFEKTEIIYNFSSVSEVPPKKESYSSKKILYLGGGAFIKGFYTMVDALDYLEEGIKVYFCGDYPSSPKKNFFIDFFRSILVYKNNKNRTLEKMRNHPKAIEIGLIGNVSEYMNHVCCLVSPFSVAHFSRPVIEAQLHKKPVIGSNVQGNG